MFKFFLKLFPKIIFLAILFGLLISFNKQELSANDSAIFCVKLLNQMVDSANSIKTVRYHFRSLERIENNFLKSETDVKLITRPLKLYVLNAEKKTELLYLDGEHSNECLVKPNSFPYVSIYLNPRGAIMRKKQHYTIYEIGFNFVAKTIKSIIYKDGVNILRHLRYCGREFKCGQMCQIVIYENKDFSYIDYVVGDKESASSISIKNFLSDYSIRVKNNLPSYDDYITKGQRIKVPTNYCKSATIYISEQTKLPVSINLNDENNLFESYLYSNVILNKVIEVEEFKRNYRGYNF